MEWSWDQNAVSDFINDHYPVILDAAAKAKNLGSDDVMIVLQLDLEEETFQVAPFIRTQVWDDIREVYPLPDEVQERLSRPAGKGAAWLAILAGSGCATMRLWLDRGVNAPGGTA